MNKTLDNTRNIDKEGKWGIECDGWYPYCSVCGQEPKDGLMTPRCPRCGAKLKPFLDEYKNN